MQQKETPRSAPGFVSSTPFEDTQPDCLVVCCSDHRFEQQSRELARNIGFTAPHVVQVPSGSVLTLPLATTLGFISKALDRIIERVVAMKHPKTVILIGHHDCGAYKEETGKHPLVESVLKHVVKKTVPELQQEHLAQAAKRLKLALGTTPVRAFYASVIEDLGIKKVQFTEVTV